MPIHLHTRLLLATALIALLLVRFTVASAPPLSRAFAPKWHDSGDNNQQQQHPLGPPPGMVVAGRSGVGYTALGDSYGAGIGTGNNDQDNKTDKCRLGTHSYTTLIYEDLVKAWEDDGGSRHGQARPVFQWRSCTAAKASDLLGQDGQIASLDSSLPFTFATLSIGGNDLGFFDVIDACVFRFYGFYSGTCAAALQRSNELINSPSVALDLEMALLSLLDAARWERQPRFAVALTGYARFFDAVTEACDDRSLGIWLGGPKLPRALRAELNRLVAAANDRLRATAAKVNARFASPRVLFVDYDAAFEGHRFCEPGVLEPDYTRNQTWFFLVGGKDNGGSGGDGGGEAGAVGREPGESTPQLTAVVDPDTCLGPARESGDWGALAVCYMAMAKQRDPSLRLARPVMADGGNDDDHDMSAQYVSVYYAKVFHPRSLGQEAIRDAVYREWRKVFDEDLVTLS